MKKRNIKIAVAIAVASLLALVVLFIISYKIALAVIFGSIFVAILCAAAYANKNAWEDLEKQDPELAKKLWQQAMMDEERNRLLYF